MCLAIPGRIDTIEGELPLRMGMVDFGGVRRRVSLAYVPEADIGDYCLVHVGFAISCIDEGEAKRTLSLLDELAVMEELGPG